MRSIIFYTMTFAAIIVLWEIAGENNTVRLLVSRPTSILLYFYKNYPSLIAATIVTFTEAACGLLFATAFSFGAMILCLYFPALMSKVIPIMVVSQVIPLITLAPLFIILFGIGVISKVLMSALLCFFPIFINFANGVKLIHQNIKDLLYIYNFSITQRIRMAYLPLSLPNIMAGLKIAATLAVIGAIVGEFSGAEIGIGKNLYLSALRIEPELMICSLMLSAILGGLMYGFIILVERRIGGWYLN